jgi:hypothetical protein
MFQTFRLPRQLRFNWIFSLAIFISLNAYAASPCRIEIVEKGTSWPVPLVELRTTHNVRFVSDNAGVIAFDLPELMGQETWFDVIADGYEVPRDAYGYSGVRFVPKSGKKVRVEVQRTIIARRLGRITGGGIFGESEKFGQVRGWSEPGVLGCDTVQTAVHRGKLYWVWGDTTLAKYPLGIFDGTGGMTSTRPLDSFEPPLELKLNYFTDKQGMPRAVAPMPGKGPTWLTGFVSLPDAKGKEHLVASYVKINPPLETYQWGLAIWDDETEKFNPYRIMWTQSETGKRPPFTLYGHATFWTDQNAKRWVFFGEPFPVMRIPATFEAWQNTNTWERIQPQTALLAADTKETVKPHGGSIAWNPWRKRWVTVFMQAEGKPSHLGELWFAEADSPTGPWGPAVKVLSHNNYTFYNPILHPEFTQADSPILIFEGTYTKEFSGNKNPTPRYDYNQILYRLDLDDPRLVPARVK